MDVKISATYGGGETAAGGVVQLPTQNADDIPPGGQTQPGGTVADTHPNPQRLDLLQSLATRESEFQQIVNQRDALRSMEKVQELLGQVGAALEQVSKQYPPYPADSPMRQRILNEVTGLRKQIENLTWPPRGEDGVNKDSRDLAALQAIVGSMGWDTLEDSVADDDALGTFSQQAEDAARAIEEARGRMWADLTTRTGSANEQEAMMWSDEAAKRLAGEPVSIGKSAADLKAVG